MSERRSTLFYNASIVTMDPVHRDIEWFMVLGERIQKLGKGPLPEGARKVDLQGRFVVPGFVDAHAHFFQTGLDMLFIDLGQASNLDDIYSRLRSGTNGRKSWIFAHGYEEDALQGIQRLEASHLDMAFPDRPVWVNRVDYHSAVVNTVGLRRLDIPVGTPGLLTSGGKPNGILRSQAYFHAKARISRLYPIETKDGAVKAASQRCIQLGLTAVHALEGGKVFGDEGIPVMLKRMHTQPLDITLFLQEKNPVYATKLGFEHLGGCILIDGSIGSYTAALDECYHNLPGQVGTLYEKTREFQAFVEEAHVAGVQLAFHAIGPRAIQMVLDAYERALQRFPRYDHRHRIEHFELATDDQIKQARDLGVVVSMQPSFEHYWGGPDGMYANRLGERWRTTNRLRTIIDAGLQIAGGSDTNVTPPDPILGIHAAVNHPNPEERVSIDEALRMMTINAAYSGHNDNRHGSLSPGKEASFTVLDRDLYKQKPEDIRSTKVLETWVKGKLVYQAQPSSDTVTNSNHSASNMIASDES
jgi:predicted amidohydrolase YtcJ